MFFLKTKPAFVIYILDFTHRQRTLRLLSLKITICGSHKVISRVGFEHTTPDAVESDVMAKRPGHRAVNYLELLVTYSYFKYRTYLE